MEHSSITNEVNSKNSPEESDRVISALSKNDKSLKSSSNDEIAEVKDVPVNDKHIGPTHDIWKKNEINRDEKINDTINIKSTESSETKTVGINGDLNNKSDENADESNLLPNDELAEVSEKKDKTCSSSDNASTEAVTEKGDITSDSNVSRSDLGNADSSQLENPTVPGENIANASCDSEDYHSAIDSGEVADQNESTDKTQIDITDEVTNDVVDNAVAQDNTVNFEKISESVQSVDNERNENSMNVLEPMEVDEPSSPVSSSVNVDKTSKILKSPNKSVQQTDVDTESQKKSKSVENIVLKDDAKKSDDNSESMNKNLIQNHEVEENNSNAESKNESPLPNGSDIDETNDNSKSTSENLAQNEDDEKNLPNSKVSNENISPNNSNADKTNQNVELINESIELSDSDIGSINETSQVTKEDAVSSKDDDQTSSTVEKLNDDQSCDYSQTDNTKDTDSTVERHDTNKAKESDNEKGNITSNSTISAIPETSKNKESSSEDTANSKNTEVLHIDENDEEPDEAMDTSECDPFGQVSEPPTTDVEEMEVDGRNSSKNVENEVVEIVTDASSIEESTTTNELESKPTQKKPSTEDSVDQVDDHCIIPDNMSSETTKPTVTKPKFDITPVRLEKLMDPSKLASSLEKQIEVIHEKNDETVNVPETNTFTVTTRPQRRAAKKAESQIKEIVAQTEDENDGSVEDVEKLSEPSYQLCYRCRRLRNCRYVASLGTKTVYICQESCLDRSYADEKEIPPKSASKSQAVSQKPSSIPDSIHFLRKCSECNLHNILEEKSLTWEAMDFCNEDCLNRYQLLHGANCAFCKKTVPPTSMGKYSVRFGLEARQFCSGVCLEEFKKGLKSCSYCQQDITKASDNISAPIGDKGQSKEFCSRSCRENYKRMSTNSPLPTIHDTCTVCAQMKDVVVQVLIQSRTHSLCSDVCFMTFKFANNISDIDQCHICKKFYEEGNPNSYFVFHDDTPFNFCSKVCMNVFILFRRKIVPCSWCKVKKYNFDMIRKSAPGGGCVMMCSLNCLSLYQVSMNATSTRKIKCDYCSAVNYAQYHLTMSDATIRDFCSYSCVMGFQTQYNKTPLTMHDSNKANSAPVPLGAPKRAVINQKTIVAPTNDLQRNSVQKSITTVANGLLPQLTSTGTLKISSPLTVATTSGSNSASLITTTSVAKTQTITKYIQQIIVKPPAPKEIVNKFTQCHINTANKGVSCQTETSTQETQTDEISKYPAVVPIPVPIYVPAPMHMFTTPFPVPVPFAIPIPVPIFIPTTKNTYKGVVQYMKEIVDKTPANPFEAELLLMAKMVANEEKPEEVEEAAKNESGEDDEMHFADAAPDSESPADSETSTSNNFNDDVLQMAMKMATEQLSNSPTVDLETELTSNTITPQTQNEDNNAKTEEIEVPVEPRVTRTRKRASKAAGDAPTRKRTRQQVAAQIENDSNTTVSQSSEISSPPLAPETERPDAKMCLKFTVGIRAWKHWLLTKNDQLEQAAVAANKKAKTFNLNILKLTTEELNYLLCQFVKEVRKPNGDEYAPDTVYYLCLSIQQYLFENGRIDNIFTDSFYEQFTNELDEVAKKFSEINDSTQYIVTRIEEEHLWESKQLGAHSPHVLLATLMFFNTKYFNLATLEEHMQLSFSHIMKHWKRNPNTPVGKPGSPAPNRNVVLRFYPPQAALDAPNSRKKKVYEQHENEVNPLRCPVKLYEFYLSKCPESVKQRNDVFYLQPERSCVPDSPVWYSTMPLQKDLLMKMLHRIRMVKEVNISLLAS